MAVATHEVREVARLLIGLVVEVRHVVRQLVVGVDLVFFADDVLVDFVGGVQLY